MQAVPVRVALLGFSNFERTSLAACFRLAAERVPHYQQVTDLDAAELLVADADHAPSVQLVQATERLMDAVFIGAQPPEEAVAWMARPIDPLHVMRELDAMVAQRAGVHTLAPPALAAAKPTPPVLTALAPAPLPAPAVAPASAHSTPPAATPAARRDRRRPPVVYRERHALVVDDSAIATVFLQRCLQPFGLHIATAAHSGRATMLMSQQRFDFIFLDVELGEGSPMDGLALCQQIRRHPVRAGDEAPVVVMVSAHHREIDRVRGTLAGCDAFLAKPLNVAELETLMRRHGVELVAPGPASAIAPAG